MRVLDIPGVIRVCKHVEVLMMRTGKAEIECISDDALKHFKTYKYSSVDLSPLSHYVLRHYVRPQAPNHTSEQH